MKRPAFLMAALVAITIAAGCTAPSSPPPAHGPATLTGTISEAGSTTVQPLAERLADAFMNLHREVTVTIQGGGSSVGIKAAADGTVDIGAASRELKADEPPLQKYLLAHSGLAIVTNPANTVSGLSADEVRKIFSGEIRNWSEVGGPDQEVIVVAREEGSGTRDAFEGMVMRGDLITSRAVLLPASGAIRTVISLTPGSIGFIAFGYLDSSVKALAIDGAPATTANVISGRYTISQPLYFLTRPEPKELSEEFIQFCLSPEGQAIAASEGYISIRTESAHP